MIVYSYISLNILLTVYFFDILKIWRRFGKTKSILTSFRILTVLSDNCFLLLRTDCRTSWKTSIDSLKVITKTNNISVYVWQ